MVLLKGNYDNILETGLTLLVHSRLSNKCWVDSFLTVVFVINRLPTPTLQNMSPYSKLYSKAPDYQRLRVFGCLCYPLLRPYNAHKLEYRSKPCDFKVITMQVIIVLIQL